MAPPFVRFLLSLILVVGSAGAAAASPIIFNTGVDATGTPLPDGTIGDPHYSLVTVPAGSTTNIRVRTSAGGYPVVPGVYSGDDPFSAWIGPNNDAQVDGPIGVYDYRTTFSGTVLSISGMWQTDNEGVNILINGSPTGNVIPDPTSFRDGFTSFTIAAGFVSGTNTLDFLVNNDGGPTALRVEITKVAAVPEPPSLVIFVTAVVGLMLMRRRKHWNASH